ncbi:MAG: ABC transporter permease, partial [Firmicutes bacterium]|nr:ABC transporter permease [Candidatus Scybalomonas excrementavium]
MKTIKIFIPHLEQLGEELIECLIQTLQMSLISGIIAFFFGIVLGVILIVTKKDGLFQNRIVYGVFDKAVD